MRNCAERSAAGDPVADLDAELAGLVADLRAVRARASRRPPRAWRM
jgi:hypothetical protein